MNSQKRIARIAGVLYLLVIGVKNVKTSKPEKSILAAFAMPDAGA